MSEVFAPGDLVHVRGREWVVLPAPGEDLLCLRPLSGAEEDIQLLHPALEREAPRHARFALPDIAQIATQDAASLLAQALRLSLRRGAGPFRSAGHVGFEPRAYQLVPLLMALRLPVIRLLIGDDVGIGKTIEAGLIIRELIDRGEIDRFSVLCPPHLVEQWTGELATRFGLDSVAITAASAPRLERQLPPSQTLFDAHPYTVVSLDYIKADRRRDGFARACPALVVVDEAHACVGAHHGRQQRFALLQRLAADAERHMVMLTATPHSGDQEAFDRLLSLLSKEFSGASLEGDTARARLARHFVQRRRIDITSKEWGEDQTFPRHETAEHAYSLDRAHKAFHEAVLDYCLEVVEGAGPDRHHRRLAFWGTLALMRCVGSSPAAAFSALRNRLAAEPERLEDQVFDEDAEDADAVDVEPASGLDAAEGPLADLVGQAETLVAAPDPKRTALTAQLKPLLDAGANPVVFCRYIATANHVADGLRKAFPKVQVEVVTGDLPSTDRRARVEAMGEQEGPRLLVATDCLSEGVNLQVLFDTVVHYDLSWNPTRHQQREGRVNRFGQPANRVRSLLLYSPDSAIDGAVLDVILRKAELIRKATGVTVPLPDQRDAVTAALMNAVLLRKGRSEQLSLDLGLGSAAQAMETRWRDAQEGERRSRARFAQNVLRPEAVLPEWRRWHALFGGPEDVARFVGRAMSRLDAPLENGPAETALAHVHALPDGVRERLEARGLDGTVRLSFREPAPTGAQAVTRNHPLPATLAEALIEGALDPGAASGASLGRIGTWRTEAVDALVTVALLRIRHKLTVHGRRERLLLAEETEALAFVPDGDTPHATGSAAIDLLNQVATGGLADVARDRILRGALERMQAARDGAIAGYARARAETLAGDHARLRAAIQGVSRVSVQPVLPVDIIGLYVLMPAGD